MIRLLFPSNQMIAGTLVESALRRSCGEGSVESVTFAFFLEWLENPDVSCWFFISPPDDWSDAIKHALCNFNTKFILFGSIPPKLGKFLGVKWQRPISDELKKASECEPAPLHSFSESLAHIRYIRPLGNCESPIHERPLLRYDFADEWNNLGFGRIASEGSPWSIGEEIDLPSQVSFAELIINEKKISSFSGLWDWSRSSLLWVNRPVGLIDSCEHLLLECYLSNYRSEELPCWPTVEEIPYGYDAAVTMRLDCDEDVESARGLFETYQSQGIPFSLALHTKLLDDSRHHSLPRNILSHGGSLLSHSASHAPDWGGDYTAAYTESRESHKRILETTGVSVRYAVSPFHQTPLFAREALSDAGYAGCIGGIIRNDPDFLMARGGVPPGGNNGFVSHSQQCMLHGDCLLDTNDPLAVFKQAFDNARKSRTLFGYLDHPFSSRYQYGWKSEEQRKKIHEVYLSYIKKIGNVLFLNEEESLDFITWKSRIQVRTLPNGFLFKAPFAPMKGRAGSIRYQGRRVPMEREEILL